MSDRFEGMIKISSEPVAKVLAQVNARLGTKLQAPANAPAPVVLAELDSKAAVVDMLQLLPILLPARERVWWACLAARDYITACAQKETPSLLAAEAWVFRPDPKNTEAARASLELAEPDDETVHCAMSVLYADGTLGPDAPDQPAPAGASAMAAFAMVAESLGVHSDQFAQYAQLLIDRAVNIARGGNGQLGPGADTAAGGG